MFYLHICSSLPWKYYNQQHCLRRHHLEQFSAVYNCSVLPLYGTLDLAQVGEERSEIQDCAASVEMMVMIM